jgi:hypothetical protein
MDHPHHAEIIEKGRNHGSLDDGEIRYTGDLGHDEAAGAHDGGHDLAADP